VKHKRFPGVEEGGLCRQDLWAIELLRTFFSGSLDMFRIRFFEERAQEIKDYIARQAHKDYIRMFREFLSVLPFDREAIEFSEKDREERARDQKRMKEIISDYDTNIKYYKWFEGGPKEFRASDNLKGYADFGGLSKAQRVDLWDEVRRGNRLARDFAVNSNIGLIYIWAHKIKELPVAEGVAFLDLRTEGLFGLMKAIEKYDPSKGTKFSTYGRAWIRQAMIRSCFAKGMIMKANSALIFRRAKLKRKIEQEDERGAGEKAKRSFQIKYRKLVREFEKLDMELKGALDMVSLYEQRNKNDEDSDMLILDSIPDEAARDPAEITQGVDDRAFVRECIDRMGNERAKRILELRYGLKPPAPEEWKLIHRKFPALLENPETGWPIGKNFLTLEEVGAVIGVTRERIRQIANRAEQEFRRVATEIREKSDGEENDPLLSGKLSMLLAIAGVAILEIIASSFGAPGAGFACAAASLAAGMKGVSPGGTPPYTGLETGNLGEGYELTKFRDWTEAGVARREALKNEIRAQFPDIFDPLTLYRFEPDKEIRGLLEEIRASSRNGLHSLARKTASRCADGNMSSEKIGMAIADLAYAKEGFNDASSGMILSRSAGLFLYHLREAGCSEVWESFCLRMQPRKKQSLDCQRFILAYGGVNPADIDRIVGAMEKIDRVDFVPAESAAFAYLECPCPIECHQTLSRPVLVGIVTALLISGKNKLGRVLEVGTGSGWLAAILSGFAEEVYSIERIDLLAEKAACRLKKLGISNAHVIFSDGQYGYPKAAPYEAIVVSCGAKEIPKPLLSQLSPGGKLIIPLYNGAEEQKLILARKNKDGELEKKDVMDVSFVPLIDSCMNVLDEPGDVPSPGDVLKPEASTLSKLIRGIPLDIEPGSGFLAFCLIALTGLLIHPAIAAAAAACMALPGAQGDEVVTAVLYCDQLAALRFDENVEILEEDEGSFSHYDGQGEVIYIHKVTYRRVKNNLKKELSRTKQATVAASDGEEFQIKYSHLEPEHLIEIFHGDEKAGFMRFREKRSLLGEELKNVMGAHEETLIAKQADEALPVAVAKKYRDRYKGIGTTLMSFAFAIAINRGCEVFILKEDRRLDDFYRHIGFHNSEGKWFGSRGDCCYNLTRPVGIFRKCAEQNVSLRNSGENSGDTKLNSEVPNCAGSEQGQSPKRGDSPCSNDPHRAKADNNLPKDPQERERAIQKEISLNTPINDEQRRYLASMLKAARAVSRSDILVARRLEAMSAMETRAGPMPNLFGVVRDYILHLDAKLLAEEKSIELMLTLLHEALSLAYPENKDEDNEILARLMAEMFIRIEEGSRLSGGKISWYEFVEDNAEALGYKAVFSDYITFSQLWCKF
ncbi:MAG: protein-L-isoaspartate(D-aspartate) O-methyltransferase, partial [Candidatus Omnitrophica bacterium]|nr:protein-L-isoaspartate(D-aspartate) O-methyltransferase [Candidatus Omnitrophota bacterium]